MKKKILCLAMALCLCLLSACGNRSASGIDVASKAELDPKVIGDYGDLKLPLDTKGTKLTITGGTEVVGADFNNSVVVKELERRTGLDLDIQLYPSSSVSQKITILLAGKENVPDVIDGIYSTIKTNDYAMQGAFAATDDYLDIIPNFREIFYTNPEKYNTVDALNRFRAKDGKNYTFVRFDTERTINTGVMMYRKDIFDKHGIKMWNNPEEFYQVLKQLKELYPQSMPFSTKNRAILSTFSKYFGMNSISGVYFDEASSSWKCSAVDPKTKEIIDLFKKMYNEGLIDPEFTTRTQASWTSLMTAKDKSFVTADWIGRMEIFKEQTMETVPEYDLRFANPVSPDGKMERLFNVADGPAIYKGKNVELAMKFMDYMISESGGTLMQRGIKGVTYEDGEDGFAKYIGFDKTTPSITELEEKYGLTILVLSRRGDKKSAYFNFTEREQEAVEIMSAKEDGGFYPYDPVPVMSDEDQERVNEILPELSKATDEFTFKYILGDESWEDWLIKAEKLNVSELVDIYNKYNK